MAASCMPTHRGLSPQPRIKPATFRCTDDAQPPEPHGQAGSSLHVEVACVFAHSCKQEKATPLSEVLRLRSCGRIPAFGAEGQGRPPLVPTPSGKPSALGRGLRERTGERPSDFPRELAPQPRGLQGWKVPTERILVNREQESDTNRLEWSS